MVSMAEGPGDQAMRSASRARSCASTSAADQAWAWAMHLSHASAWMLCKMWMLHVSGTAITLHISYTPTRIAQHAHMPTSN